MQAGTHTSRQAKTRGSILQGKDLELLSWLKVTPWKCKEGRTYTSLSTEYYQAERFAGQEDLKTTGPHKGSWLCLLSDISLPGLRALSRKNELRWTDSQLLGDMILFQ